MFKIILLIVIDVFIVFHFGFYLLNLNKQIRGIMSVCIVVKVGEGLVLASDSASTVSGAPITPERQQGPQGIVKIFFNSTKIFQISTLPVGILTWGAASFQSRTIASLVEEFENREEIRQLAKENLEIKILAKQIWDFLCTKSDELFGSIPTNARPSTGIIVGGYSKEQFFPEEYHMVIPVEEPNLIRPDENGRPNFGTNWYGMTDAIVRFHHGRDDRIFGMLEGFGISAELITKIRDKIGLEIQYPVLFDAMPLGDAIEYAKFLVHLTISRFRFVIGAELCGGPIDIATITRKEGFKWISRKKIN